MLKLSNYKVNKLIFSKYMVGVASIGLVGSVLLLSSQAVTPTASFESESGTLANGASNIADVTASGGHAVQFSSSSGSIPADLVSICGRQFCMDGSTWRLNGGSTNGNPSGSQSRWDNMDLALQLQVNEVRLTDFLNSHGTPGTDEYDETRWVAVDDMIARAAQYHIKIELDLATFRNMMENYSTTYNMYQAKDWNPFLTWVANRTNTVTGRRYGSDPTIAIVSFAGETGTPDSTNYINRGITAQTLIDFYNNACTQWSQLGPNQIRMPGGLFHLTDKTLPWQQIYALQNCTLPAIHSYSTTDENGQPGVNTYTQSIGKPWLLEEFGFGQKNYPDDASRATDFKRQVDLANTNGAAGVSWWNINLGNNVATDGGIYPSLYPQTVAALRSYDTGPATRRFGDDLIGNRDFETDINSWNADSNTSLSRTTGASHSRTASLQLTSGSAGTVAASSSQMTITAGNYYNFSIFAEGTASGRTGQVIIDWYNAGGSIISSTTGSARQLAMGEWLLLDATGKAPAGAVKAVLRTTVSGVAANDKTYLDDAYAVNFW